jgi:hypothetical protein
LEPGKDTNDVLHKPWMGWADRVAANKRELTVRPKHLISLHLHKLLSRDGHKQTMEGVGLCVKLQGFFLGVVQYAMETVPASGFHECCLPLLQALFCTVC